MLACAIPLKTYYGDVARNQREVIARLKELPSGVRLVVLPELTLTGYLDDPSEVASFAEDVQGHTASFFSALAKRYNAWFVFSFIEQDEGNYYIAALLMNPNGEIALHQRKMKEKAPFSSGTEVQDCRTPLGNVALLLCGDLFSPEVTSRLGAGVDILIVPMARCFDGNTPDAERWEREERGVYVEQARRAAARTLVCNALDADGNHRDFGGALWIDREQGLLAESPHGTDELLLAEL